MDCWASILGDCGEGKSGEHYISDGIFDGETVTAVGLPWCRDDPVTIGMSSAVAKILCCRHNAALSPFDAEAAKLSKFVRDNVFVQPLAEASISLKGDRIEKWALKTLFNLGYIRGLNREQSNRIDPPAHLVRYVFLGEPVADGVGLYFVTSQLSNDERSAGVWWNSIGNLNNKAVVFGMTFTFFGIRFVVSMPPMRAEKQIAGMPEFVNASVVYRPPGIGLAMISGAAAGRKQITFEW